MTNAPDREDTHGQDGTGASRIPLDPLQVMTIHQVNEGPARGWIHTHGLAFYGLPELEIRCVPMLLGGGAARLLNDIADYMLNIADKPVVANHTMTLGHDAFRFVKSHANDNAGYVANHYDGVTRLRLVDLDEYPCTACNAERCEAPPRARQVAANDTGSSEECERSASCTETLAAVATIAAVHDQSCGCVRCAIRREGSCYAVTLGSRVEQLVGNAGAITGDLFDLEDELIKNITRSIDEAADRALLTNLRTRGYRMVAANGSEIATVDSDSTALLTRAFDEDRSRGCTVLSPAGTQVTLEAARATTEPTSAMPYDDVRTADGAAVPVETQAAGTCPAKFRTSSS